VLLDALRRRLERGDVKRTMQRGDSECSVRINKMCITCQLRRSESIEAISNHTKLALAGVAYEHSLSFRRVQANIFSQLLDQPSSTSSSTPTNMSTQGPPEEGNTPSYNKMRHDLDSAANLLNFLPYMRATFVPQHEMAVSLIQTLSP
jgi:hypothetical protein